MGLRLDVGRGNKVVRVNVNENNVRIITCRSHRGKKNEKMQLGQKGGLQLQFC